MITELCIFDFDATLFMSPMFPDDWEGHTGQWFDTLQSLTPPCVIDPGPLWIGEGTGFGPGRGLWPRGADGPRQSGKSYH